MSVTLKFCVTKAPNCSYLTINDNTGAYSANNLGGWGAPNYDISTVTSATMLIQQRQSDGTFVNTPIYPASVYNALPSNSMGSTNILASAVGYGTAGVFPDGIYLMTYTVNGNSSGAYSLTAQNYYFHTCAIDTCYQKAALASSTCNCVCDDINAKLRDIAYYYRVLQAAKKSGNLTDVQKYIDLLTKLCASYGGCNC